MTIIWLVVWLISGAPAFEFGHGDRFAWLVLCIGLDLTTRATAAKS